MTTRSIIWRMLTDQKSYVPDLDVSSIPEIAKYRSLVVDSLKPVPKVPLTPLQKSVLKCGIPTMEGATTPKEDVIGLLMLAAEVEHALMVQYLYTAFSTRGQDSRVIGNIAVEEMGHLITVQNLLLSLTGLNQDGLPKLIHLGRDEIRKNSPRNPLPFILEKVSRKALAKYVVAERPDHIEDGAVRQQVEALEREVEADGEEANPVYALYAAIRWIFQSSDTEDNSLELSPELGLRSGWHLKKEDFVDSDIVDNYASTIDEWHSYPGLIVMPVRNGKEGLQAIDAITEQGEGAPGSDDSHFREFLKVLNRYETGSIRVRDLPRTPFIDSQPSPEDPFPTEIKSEYTKLWAQLFNLEYELLLLDIAWGISQSRRDQKRQEIIDLAIDSMTKIIRPLSDYMTRRRLDDDSPAKAGPTYGLGQEQFPSNPIGYVRRYNELIQKESYIISSIQNRSEIGSDIIGQNRLSEIEMQTNARMQYLPQGE